MFPVKLWLYAAAAAALLAALGGIYGLGYKAGADKVQTQWLQANALAEEASRKSRLAREDESRKAANLLAATDRKAREADARWRAERAKRKPLAVAACPASAGPVDSSAPDTGQYRPADGIRFTPAGLGLWDAAWTGEEGEPVFGDPGSIAAGAVESTTPLPTLEDAVDTHAENASRCSENRRQLVSLIELIQKLQKQDDY